MPLTCTITRAGRHDEFGRELAPGVSYTGANEFVRDLCRSGYATVSDPLVFDDDDTPHGAQWLQGRPDGSIFTAGQDAFQASVSGGLTAATASALESANPAVATPRADAWVGSAAPYLKYASDGTRWGKYWPETEAQAAVPSIGPVLADAGGNLILPNGGVYIPPTNDNIIVVPAATSNPLTNYNNIMSAINSAGIGGRIMAPGGQVYTLNREIIPLSGQLFLFNQSRLKLANQIYTTLTSPATLNSTGLAPTVTFQVASSTGFFVGMRVGLQDDLTAGQTTRSIVLGVVTAVASGRVTVQFDGINAVGMAVAATVNTSTWAETQVTTYTWPSTANLASISRLFYADPSKSFVQVLDLELDGNRANNQLANRWELSCLADQRSSNGRFKNIYAHDAVTDGIYSGGLRCGFDTIRVYNTGSFGFHVGASGASTGGQRTNHTNMWLDSPGLGTPANGHQGGYPSHPSYAALGFSRNTDHNGFSNIHITNDNGAIGTTFGQAIGCITNGDNYALDFSHVFISGFNKGYGAIQIRHTNSTGGIDTDPPGDVNKPPQLVSFDALHVDNCGPTTLATLQQWEICAIGASSGNAPHATRVFIKDSDFTDSPLVIQDAHVTFAGRNEFVATAIGNSSSLILLGSNCDTDISGVISRRVVTTSGNYGSIPGADSYRFNIRAAGNAKVRGDNVTVINGHAGVRVEGGASWDVSNLKAADQYDYGLAAVGSATVALQSPRVTLSSGYTASSTWQGITAGAGAGALTSGSMSIESPSVSAVTTAAGQAGIKLCPTAAVPCTVSGGKVKVSGTSTTPIASGGASGIGVVAGVLLSHAFTAGAAETAANTVVSANA